MDITFPRVFVASTAFLIVLTRFYPQYAPFAGRGANVATIYGLFFSALFVWRIWLWPFVFSPLRNLPSPKVCTIISQRIFKELKSLGWIMDSWTSLGNYRIGERSS